MPDGAWRPVGPKGPGYPSIYNHDNSSSLRTVPIYALFLIMVGSGVFTLLFLWVCVHYIYYKRRVRRQATTDVEESSPSAPDVKEIAVVTSKCDHQQELTYVVMAGEDLPTFLARPLSDLDPPSPSPSPPNDDDDDDAAHSVKEAES